MPEIENQIIEKSKRTISRSVVEGESATNADIIEEFYNLINLPPNDRLRRADFLHC